jgi:hypothetical protein
MGEILLVVEDQHLLPELLGIGSSVGAAVQRVSPGPDQLGEVERRAIRALSAGRQATLRCATRLVRGVGSVMLPSVGASLQPIGETLGPLFGVRA